MASCVAGIADISHHAQLVCWDGGLSNFLPGLASNCDPSNLSVLSSWNYMCEQLCSALSTHSWYISSDLIEISTLPTLYFHCFKHFLYFSFPLPYLMFYNLLNKYPRPTWLVLFLLGRVSFLVKLQSWIKQKCPLFSTFISGPMSVLKEIWLPLS
jgi:hypothetical protein